MSEELLCPVCQKPANMETYNEINETLQFQDCAGFVNCWDCGLELRSPLCGTICGMKSYDELDEKWEPTAAQDWLRKHWALLSPPAPVVVEMPPRAETDDRSAANYGDTGFADGFNHARALCIEACTAAGVSVKGEM